MRNLEHNLAEKADGRLVAFALNVVAVALHQSFFPVSQLGKLLRLALIGPCIPAIHADASKEGVHLILVAALKEGDVLRRSVSVCLPRIQRQASPVSFWEGTYAEYLIEAVQASPRVSKLLGADLQQVGDGLAAELLHHMVRDGDGLLLRPRLSGSTALSDDALEILMGTLDERQQGDTCTTG